MGALEPEPGDITRPRSREQALPGNALNEVLIEEDRAILVIVAHRPMRHAAVDDFRAESDKTQALVKAQLVGLGSKIKAAPTFCAGLFHGPRDHLACNAAAAESLAHRDPANLDVFVHL